MIQYEDAERFASQLRMLRERAGDSYEALAQKTGISRSSLHRYCAGSSVPQDYGAAHRIAMACGATPAELRELHRLWALADVERGPRALSGDAESTREDAGEAFPTESPAAPAAGDRETSMTRGQVDEPALSEPPTTRRRTRLLRGRRLAAGAATATALVLGIVAWEASHGASSTGSAEAADRRPLLSVVCRPVVSMGQHDECVREVQQLLRRHGAAVDVDSDFGPQTLRRVTAFQVFAGIAPNGVVADPTKKALYESPVRLDTWSPDRVRGRIREVFTEAPDDAVAIADCQSFLDPLHILPNTNGTRNWGLFQISDGRLRELGGTPRKALDPEWNIQAAEQLWSRKHDFHDWPNCERALRSTPTTSVPSPAR
ncbi:helix-turn-helix domain-containing protein [Streptomyces sp. B21-083]|uniref:helix-turn-helix domain-containing protein n=1 Tax=Streptomyces sp. B21-083 TaxID=3039410 RepID=UPI002FF08006